MAELLHKRGPEDLISKYDTEEISEYVETIMGELPPICENCPAAHACAGSMLDGTGISFPRTPGSVRSMQIDKKPGGGYSLLSSEAQRALKAIVRGANEGGTGPNEDGDICCLDPDTKIEEDNYQY